MISISMKNKFRCWFVGGSWTLEEAKPWTTTDKQNSQVWQNIETEEDLIKVYMKDDRSKAYELYWYEE